MICTEKKLCKGVGVPLVSAYITSIALAHNGRRLTLHLIAGYHLIYCIPVKQRGWKGKTKTDFQTLLWTLWYFFIGFIMLGKLGYLLKCFNVKSSYTKYSRIIGFGWNSPYHISDNIGFLLSICAQPVSYIIWHTWFIALWNTVILFHLHEFFCYVSWKLVSVLTSLVENYATERIL